MEWVAIFLLRGNLPNPGDGTQVSLHCRQTLLPSEPPGTGHRMSQNKMPQCEGARDTCSGLTAPCVWVGKTHTAANVPLSPWGRGAPRRHQTGVDLSAMEGTPPPSLPPLPPPRAPVGHKPAWLWETSKDAPFREGGGWHSSAQRCPKLCRQGCSGEKSPNPARAGGADAPH